MDPLDDEQPAPLLPDGAGTSYLPTHESAWLDELSRPLPAVCVRWDAAHAAPMPGASMPGASMPVASMPVASMPAASRSVALIPNAAPSTAASVQDQAVAPEPLARSLTWARAARACLTIGGLVAVGGCIALGEALLQGQTQWQGPAVIAALAGICVALWGGPLLVRQIEEDARHNAMHRQRLATEIEQLRTALGPGQTVPANPAVAPSPTELRRQIEALTARLAAQR